MRLAIGTNRLSGGRVRGLLTCTLVSLMMGAPVFGWGQVAPPPAGSTPPPPSPSAAGPQSDEHKPITKEQAKELFKSVDDILQFVSQDSALPIKQKVKRRLISREQVNKYLRQKFDEDKGTQRMERSEIVLKKFGLLDRDFNLRPFLISLLTEQVAGFYDNKTKTVNLLDWIQPDEQKPVLAHELTHALQDQTVDLTKWSDVGSDDIAHNVEQDNQHIQTDEASTARDAVAEGQAMVVFVDYTLKPLGRNLKDSPELADKMSDSVADSNDSPILARAPLLLQQSLLFPYSEGLTFETAILSREGRKAAFADVLATPPASTAEIMHPAKYMAHAPVPVLRMPDIHPLIDKDWLPYDVGVMGEFDVKILTELFGGDKIADALTPEWNGGIYYAAQKRSAVTPEEKNSTASVGILYASEWKDEDSARSFARVYEEELPRKYSGLVRRPKDEQSEDEQVYSTDEGDVLLTIVDNGVFVSEGFALELARKLRHTVMSAQASGPLQVAGTRKLKTPFAGLTLSHDPGMDLVQAIQSAGLMRVALRP